MISHCFVFIFININIIISLSYSLNCKISLVIPTVFMTYMRCIKRITYMICKSYLKPNEAIVVISEFNSTKILKYHKCYVNFILYFKRGKHNQAENRNTGIKIAKCNYISFFDSDDYMSRSRIKIIYNTLISDKKIDLILHSYTFQFKFLYEEYAYSTEKINIFYNYSFLDIYNSYVKNINRSINLKYCCRFLSKSINIHNAWISGKSEIFKINLYNENRRYYRIEDTELNYRLIMKKYNLILIKLKLGIYIPHSSCNIKNIF